MPEKIVHPDVFDRNSEGSSPVTKPVLHPLIRAAVRRTFHKYGDAAELSNPYVHGGRTYADVLRNGKQVDRVVLDPVDEAKQEENDRKNLFRFIPSSTLPPIVGRTQQTTELSTPLAHFKLTKVSSGLKNFESGVTAVSEVG
jgi:hypothetical protein